MISPTAVAAPGSTPTSGMLRFLIVWSGQMVSLFGTAAMDFSLGVWVFQRTGSVTDYAMVGLCTWVPLTVGSFIAGSVVDRYDRRKVLIISDCAGFAISLGVGLLVAADLFQPGHVLPTVAVHSSINAFRVAAYGASVALLVPPEQAGRAGGLVQLASSISQLAPAAAGVLVAKLGLLWICVLDAGSYVLAIGTLLAVPYASPARSEETTTARVDPWFGLRYLRQRPGLFHLLLMFAGVNFFLGLVTVLEAPLVLAFATPAVLGAAVGLGAIGMMAGGLLMSVWGGPRRRVVGVLVFLALMGVGVAVASLRPSFPVIAGGLLLFYAAIPIYLGSAQALWQTKVATEVQGRVFAVRNVVALAAVPPAYLIAGPLIEKVFDPLMAPGGALADSAGMLIGVGPGRGTALSFLISGIVIAVAVGLAATVRSIRRVDLDIPDAT